VTWGSADSPESGALTGVPVLPVATGLLAGLAVQGLALVALTFAVLTDAVDDPAGTAFSLRLAIPGALGIALACGVAARVCAWRCRGRDLARRAELRAAVLAGVGTGTVVLALGLVLALSWSTLPLYLVGVAAGVTLERWAAGRRS
jgi:hypothetical protein